MYGAREVENSSPFPATMSFRRPTWTRILYRYSSRCSEFSAFVDDPSGIVIVHFFGRRSRDLRWSAETICPSASEELLGRVHTTLEEYNYLGRVVFTFQSCGSFPCRLNTSSCFGSQTPRTLVTFRQTPSSAAHPSSGTKGLKVHFQTQGNTDLLSSFLSLPSHFLLSTSQPVSRGRCGQLEDLDLPPLTTGSSTSSAPRYHAIHVPARHLGRSSCLGPNYYLWL